MPFLTSPMACSGPRTQDHCYITARPRLLIVKNNYSQVCQINAPRSLILDFFQPPDLIRDPPFTNFKEIGFLTNSSFHFLSLLVLFTPIFMAKWRTAVYVLVLCFMTPIFALSVLV